MKLELLSAIASSNSYVPFVLSKTSRVLPACSCNKSNPVSERKERRLVCNMYNVVSKLL